MVEVFNGVKNALYIALAVFGTWVFRREGRRGWREVQARPGRAAAWVLAGLGMMGVASALYGIVVLIIGRIEPGGNQAAIDAELLASTSSLPQALLLLGVVGLFAPIVEELVFRQTPFGSLQQHLPTPLAFVMSTLPFSLMHVTSVQEWPLTVFYVGSAVAFSIAYLASNRNILVPVAVHVLWNGTGTAFQLLTHAFR